jgi:hypothetical protein
MVLRLVEPAPLYRGCINKNSSFHCFIIAIGKTYQFAQQVKVMNAKCVQLLRSIHPQRHYASEHV